jgi:hypothetical protein
MTTIVTRAGKGSPLTNNEVDTNFTNLNDAKIETLTSVNGTVLITGTGSARNLSVVGGGGGGGSAVSYYLNGGTNQGSFSGNTYYEMSRTAVLGADANFTISANGYIAQFITDANDPSLLSIPAGNWNFELWFQSSSGGGSPSFYVELYKYDGTTFTLISSGSGNPEAIDGGTTTDLYYTALAVPTTTLTVTDRLAIRVYVDNSGQTITLHTQANNLCEIQTTFSTGLTALNTLTTQIQAFATGTSGSDFNIASVTDTHTFNLPSASAANRGLLTSADWTTFNGKAPSFTYTTNYIPYGQGTTTPLQSANLTFDGTTLTTNALLASSVSVNTSGTDAQISPNTGITGWIYSGQGRSIATEDTQPTGLFFSPDGVNMYVIGATGLNVLQYTLSTAYNPSTATYTRAFSVSGFDTSPQDIFFRADGLRMYVLGAVGDVVLQYSLSTAWNISTASYSTFFYVSSWELAPTGLWFSPDGLRMYVIGNNDVVYQFSLGTAWTVNTASFSQNFNIGTQESSPVQVNLSADGTKMWVSGSTGDDISEYSLSNPFNVNSATFVNSFYTGFQDSIPAGLFIDSTADNRVYVLGEFSDSVFRYNTATNSISAVTDVFNTTSNARVQGNLAVQSNAYVDGALTVQGSTVLGAVTTAGLSSTQLTVSGGFTASSSTSSINIGNLQSTATIVVGGTSGSGTITLGRSTGTQTTNIQAGTTASGATKTINLGTGGLAGSTTAITVGSTTGTSTTNLQGILQINGSAGSAGQVLTSGGSGTAPSWTVAGASITDDTTTNATRYLAFTSATSGTLSTVNTSSTKLTYNPSTGTASATVFSATSDERLKDEITIITDALAKIKQLRGINYKWKDSGLAGTGLSAQDVQRVVPEAVVVAPNGDLSVAYGNLLGLLVEGMKDLAAQVEELKAKVGK